MNADKILNYLKVIKLLMAISFTVVFVNIIFMDGVSLFLIILYCGGAWAFMNGIFSILYVRHHMSIHKLREITGSTYRMQLYETADITGKHSCKVKRNNKLLLVVLIMFYIMFIYDTFDFKTALSEKLI